MNKTPQACAISPADQELVDRILKNTDWDKFWADVHAKAAPQIEAYRRASVRSYQTAHQRWFY